VADQDIASLRAELLAMAEEDLRVRAELASDGSLFEGYHPRMRAVHDRNAARLAQILDERGWPRPSLVGERAAEAAWLVLQHAIGHPALQRRGLRLLQEAASVGEAPRAQVAMLEDRVRTCEGRPQLYGTQLDWDEHGLMSPLPIEDEPNVDARRREAGLGPLAEHVRRKRDELAREGARPPADAEARKRERDAWARSVGWRT
jgi:hypothetical protein